MTTEANQTTTEPASRKLATTQRERLVVVDSGPLANLFDTARFEHMSRIAAVMAGASLIPDHMWSGKGGDLPVDMVKANCFLVVNQAVRWGMDPFAVVPETYVVGGKLGFQGKLVAAVINARAPITGPLNYAFSGEKGKDNFTVTVSATIEGETEPRTITLSVGEAKTDNKMWSKDPEQKLVYSGATKWARRHCPEVILGVLTDDDADAINHQGVDNAKQVNDPVKPAFKRSKPEPEILSAETTVVPASEILPPDKVASGSQESPDKATTAESAKPVTSTAQPVLKEATHEVTKAPGSAATTKESGQQAPATNSPASAADETQDPCAPLLKKIKEAQQTYGIKDEDVIAFAKEQAILPRRSSMALDDLMDNILGLIVNALPKLVAKHGGDTAP